MFSTFLESGGGRRKLLSEDLQSNLSRDIQVANEEGAGRWELRNISEKGWGIYALRSFEPDELLFASTALGENPTRNSHTVQKDFDRHVYMNLPARLINHSCSANVGILDNADGAYDFYAIRHIAPGDELTWDYGAAEFETMSIEKCLCGSVQCRQGKNIGFKASQGYILAEYGAYYAEYLKKWSALEIPENALSDSFK